MSRIDLQGFQYRQFREQFFFLTTALVVTLLQMLGVSHIFNRIHDVFERFLHFSELVLNRGDACSGITTALFE
ncbi:MAG: hypothetical protein EA396_07995 [Anaerolineaceae bacterium]|nr:MAG: hypothetical protein EA396_07995 [Anaerolineaceae bacterium]